MPARRRSPAREHGHAVVVVPPIPGPLLPLPRTNVPQPPDKQADPVSEFLKCSGPTARSGPAFEVLLRRPILVSAGDSSSLAGGADPTSPANPSLPRIGGVALTLRDTYFGLDTVFKQTWNLVKLSIGDLASTMGLAPREQLTLEFQTSQRKTFDQSTLDSTESIDAVESTTSDKEAVNVVRASSKTEGWHVDGTAAVSCGYASGDIKFGYSKVINESNQQTVNHVAEATRKSAHNLKTLHSISVRGVSETFVQNRMTRVLRNPYHDRALSINVFQLLKTYSVETAWSEMRAAAIVRIDSCVFDNAFVLNHAAFLRRTLVDDVLREDLDAAIRGAKPPVQTGARETALDASRRALRFLFNLDVAAPPLAGDSGQLGPGNILNQPDLLDARTNPDGSKNSYTQNDPQTSFDGSYQGYKPPDQSNDWFSNLGTWIAAVATAGTSLALEGSVAAVQAAIEAYKEFNKNEQSVSGSSGYDTAARTRTATVLSSLSFFNAIIRTERVPDPSNNDALTDILDVGDNAIQLAVALGRDLDQQWTTLFPDPIKSSELQAVMSGRNFTEVIRRVPGFLAYYRNVIQPLVEPAASDASAISEHIQDVFALERVKDHLVSYGSFYTQAFLQYVSDMTHNQAVVDFASAQFGSLLFNDPPFSLDPNDFDFDRAFVAQREIIAPGMGALDPAGLSAIGPLVSQVKDEDEVAAPVSIVEEIEVPCDGVHLEVAEGVCPLVNQPPIDNALPATLTGVTIGLPP
jgi:hypothetical protein